MSVVGLAMVMAGCSNAPSTSPPLTATGALTATPSVTAVATPGPSPTIARAKAEGQIVFAGHKNASSPVQIYVENADGTDVRQLVVSDYDDQGPALSPDGRRVAFTRYGPEGFAEGGVFVMNIDGTGLMQLDKDGEDVSWSSDGTQLVETRGLFEPSGLGPYNVALWIMDADGSNAHQITLVGLRCVSLFNCTGGVPGEPGGQDNEGRWSPLGDRIAFLHDSYTSPETWSIFTSAIDGSDIRRVTPVGMEVGNPHWSPDGTRIVFQSPKEPVSTGEQNLYVINADGTGLTQLTAHLPSSASGAQGTFHPCWSPDGKLIVFSHYPGSSPDRASLYVMNADGSDLHLLAPSNLDQNGAEWGPLPAQ
jgi:TolB protein